MEPTQDCSCLEELQRSYRDARLAQLKYENLEEVCRSLLRPWPNDPLTQIKQSQSTSFDGNKKEQQVAETEITALTVNSQSSCEAVLPPTAETTPPPSNEAETEVADVQLLNEILSKARRIRQAQPEIAISKVRHDKPRPPNDKLHPPTSRPRPSSARTKSAAARTIQMASGVYGPAQSQPARVRAPSKPTRQQAPCQTARHRAHKLTQRHVSRSSIPSSSAVTMGNGKQSSPSLHSAKGLSSQASKALVAKQPQHEPALDGEAGLSRGRERARKGRGHSPGHSEMLSRGDPREQLDRSAASAFAGEAADPGLPPMSISSEGEAKEMFCVRRDGHKLAMPRKLRQLQEALSSLTQQLDSEGEDFGFRGDGERFFERLSGEGGLSEKGSTGVRLVLAAEELELLRETVVSMRTEEWAVSERSSADTLYRTKLKLDLIQERVKALERETDRASSSEPPLSALSSLSLGSSHPASLKLDPKLERVEALGRETDRASSSEPPQSSVSLRPSLPASLSPPPLQVFSSLEDWHTTAVAEDRARLLEVERAVSLCCRDVLLPLACQTPPQSKHYLQNLQLLHSLSGQKDKPIYLLVDSCE